MGLAALTALRGFETRAATLDATLIDGRVNAVQKNVKQIEGMYRSDNYVRRLAGLSQDVSRKSQNTRAVRWFFATAGENNAKALEFRAFWQGVFDFSDHSKLVLVARDFWTVEEETMVLFSRLRKCHLDGNRTDERVVLTQIRQNVDAMLRISSATEFHGLRS